MRYLSIFFIIFALGFFLLLPNPAFPVVRTDALTYFSMGYYYLYNGDLQKAKEQFELALRITPDPPALLFTILAEISDMMGDQEKARGYVFRAIEIDPENESALSMAALFLINEKEYAKALEYLEKVNSKKPGELQTLYYMAEAYSGLGREDKLIELYNKILVIKPDLVDIRLNLGYLYTKRGDFKRAKEEYTKALEADPENEKAVFYLTYIYLSEGNADEASALFRKLDDKKLLNDEMLEDYAANIFVEGQDPHPILARIRGKETLKDVTKAIILFMDGRYDEAKALFESEVQKDTGNLAALTGLVRIAEKKENRDMAMHWRFVLAGTLYDLRNLERALEESLIVKEMDPAFLENRYLLGDILGGMGKKAEALQEYLYFSDHSEEKGDIFIKLGFLYDEMKKHEESAGSFLKATELEPTNDELYYYLGVEYRLLGNHERAARAFLKASELNDKNAFYDFYLGASLERLGKIDEAIRYLDRSVQLDDKNPAALNYLGYLLADKGVRLQEAKSFIERALAIDPQNGAYLDSLGWVYYRLSDYQKAREYLESAVRSMDTGEEENYLIYDHLGDTYFKIGMVNEALEAWEKALQMKYVEEIQLKIKEFEKELQR